MNGLFITFEGLDKAGKTTQIARLATRLERLGHTVFSTREPGGTPLCEEIRQILMKKQSERLVDEAELLLFSASRAQLLREKLWPELDAGHIVLCDRFADSTTAYQGYARGMDLEFIRQLNAYAIGNRWPDLTLFLDLTVEESFKRLGKVLDTTKAEVDRFEIESRRFYEQVRKGFLELAAGHPERIVTLDATQSVEELDEQIWKIVQKRLPRIES
ncbi:MAG: dTMP kinase [Victivallales bacterium]|nr:dTMP kinase [Victivallales bacterium]